VRRSSQEGITNTSRILTALALLISAGLMTSQAAAAATTPPRKQLIHAINHARAAHGLRSVQGAPNLRTVALGHSSDMLRRDYFAHTSPTGSTMSYRIQQSGFITGYSWLAGETLAWGWGTQAGARATVKAWMHSPEHRAILLSSTYRWVGIGRQCGRFLGHANACVWTADFVTRW
jgi:uncharacterized protein YkwD